MEWCFRHSSIIFQSTNALNLACPFSDFARDKGNRRSITSYLVHLFCVPIAWRSRQQGGVSLGSSEAEYYAVSEFAKELIFLQMISDFLEIKFSEPMKIKVDNMGAIHLANNVSSGSRTKHIYIDTRIHFCERSSNRYLYRQQHKSYILEIDIKIYDWGWKTGCTKHLA
jgi:hypothetical protein